MGVVGMSRKQGPHAVGMRPAVNAALRLFAGVQGKEVAAWA